MTCMENYEIEIEETLENDGIRAKVGAYWWINSIRSKLVELENTNDRYLKAKYEKSIPVANIISINGETVPWTEKHDMDGVYYAVGNKKYRLLETWWNHYHRYEHDHHLYDELEFVSQWKLTFVQIP